MSSERTCLDCGTPISARRRRCPACKKADHARAMREYRAADAGHAYDSRAEADERVVDLTGPWAAAKPPTFPGIKEQPAPLEAEPAVISDGRVASPQARWEAEHARSVAGIPNDIRRDRVRLDSVLKGQNLGGGDDLPEMTTWDDLQQNIAARADDRVVSFHVPAPGSPAITGQLRPPAPDPLGRSVRGARNGLR
jgi:hypothetical protein